MVLVTLKHFLKLVVSPSELTKWHSLMCLTVKHAAVQRYHLLQKCFSVNYRRGKKPNLVQMPLCSTAQFAL